MNRSLFPRLFGGAIVLSVLLLLVAWYVGGSGPAATPRAAATLEGEDLPGRFDADPGDPRGNPLQAVERSTFLTEQDGKRTTLSWEVLTPRTDFVSDVESPRARVELGPGRLLVLEAAEGTVEHPGNDFQRGNFRGGTVATFHRVAADGDAVSDATAVLRLALAAPTTFDRELGRLTTNGAVRVTGPRVDLVGEGLELDFSRADELVRKLVLDRTETLRLRREQTEGAGAARTEPAESDRAAGSAIGAEAAPGPGVAPAGAGEPEPGSSEGDPVYRVEASGAVTVEADSGATLSGETLLLHFAAGEGLGAGDAEESADRGPEATKTPAVRGSAGDETTADAPVALADPDAEDGSLFRPGPGTVTLRWTGPLRLRPAEPGEGPEEARAPGFSGAHLQIAGTPDRPATASSGAASVTADRLAYATDGGRLTALGAAGRPVVAEDPTAGRLTAAGFEARPADGEASATGPGALRASDPEAETEAGDALRVRFRDAMTLAFDPASGSDAEVALREAVFTGGVAVRAEAPAEAGAEPASLATGGGPMRLDASRVTLRFGPAPGAGGRPVPESLLADGGVDAARAAGPDAAEDAPPAWTLRSEDLRVSLRAGAEAGRPEIDGLEATGGVVVRTADAAGAGEPAEPLSLRADRLVASPGLDRVELNGRPDAPAVAERGRVTLTGGTVIAALSGDRLEVRGPGSLQRDAAADAAATRLTWTDSLAYDAGTGEAEALGETLTTSDGPGERRRIEAGDVRATFDPEAEAGDAGGEEPSGGFASLRRLRAAAPAGGNGRVVVVSETLDATGEAVSTLRAEGPSLDLDAMPGRGGGDRGRQLLTMPGPGRLILVDDRPAEEAGGEAEAGGVRLAGRGATFFRWADALRLDGESRDAELTGSVFMNHDPRDGRPRVKLYGDRLLASFTGGDADVIGGGAAADAELRRVRIDGNVVVEQEERTITADHLNYETGGQEVQLWSDANRGMSIAAGGRTVPAQTATWNLATDRVDIRGVTGGSAPVPGSPG